MYLPGAMYYLNMYYLTGVAKGFEVFKCLGGKGGEPQYLAASPSMVCWEGEHLRLLPFAAIVLTVYLVGVPATYWFIMFKLVPRYSLGHKKINAHYGFIWARHEKNYHWWEVR